MKKSIALGSFTALALGLFLAVAPTRTAEAEPSVSCTTSVTWDAWGTYVSKKCKGLSSSYQFRTKVECNFLGGVGVNYGPWRTFGSGSSSKATCGPLSTLRSHSIQTRRK